MSHMVMAPERINDALINIYCDGTEFSIRDTQEQGGDPLFLGAWSKNSQKTQD